MLIDAFNKLNIASVILLILFGIACVIQLVFAFFELEKYRRIEKPFLLALLTAFAAVTLPDHPFIYAATFVAMLGDIFVILPNKKFFYLGAFCFFMGFLFYALEALVKYMGGSTPIYMFVVIFGTYIVMVITLGFFIGPRIADNMGESVGIGLYLAPLITLIPIMTYVTVKGGYFMFLSLIGVCFFLFSDSLITYTKFVKKFKRYDFFVMGTYLIAEFLIVMGFTLSYLAR